MLKTFKLVVQRVDSNLERTSTLDFFSTTSLVLMFGEIPSFGGSDFATNRFPEPDISPTREKMDELKMPRKCRRSA